MKKKPNIPFVEKAVAAWLRYDPFVSLVVRNDNRLRRDVMLNLLGKQAAQTYFGEFRNLKPEDGPIDPETVRRAVDEAIRGQESLVNLIKKLIYWATDEGINNRYIDSHVTRLQIVSSLLGEVFVNATRREEDMILKGLKYMLAEKPTAIRALGEQSYDVHELLLARVTDMLIYNQKVIVNKAITEAEEKMRAHLLRQIQELRGKEHLSAFSTGGCWHKTKISKEKFPLRREAVHQMEEILDFYTQNEKWGELREKAIIAKETIMEIRKPLTLTDEQDAK